MHFPAWAPGIYVTIQARHDRPGDLLEEAAPPFSLWQQAPTAPLRSLTWGRGPFLRGPTPCVVLHRPNAVAANGVHVVHGGAGAHAELGT